MESAVDIITGPSSSKVTREEAEAKLTAHPRFPKGASYKLEDVEGRWIAAIAKVAAPPAFAEEGSPAPDGPPAPEGPPSDGPPSEDGPPSDEGEEKPKGEKGEKEKGEKGELAEVLHLLTTLMTALGLDPSGAEGSPVPGLDEGPPAPPGDAAPPGTDAEGKTHTVHERALKPGEAPPGTTPVGAPAFASVADDHPWKEVIGKKRSFTVESEIGDQNLSTVKSELESLAVGTGYRIAQLREGTTPDGTRTASAIIAAA